MEFVATKKQLKRRSQTTTTTAFAVDMTRRAPLNCPVAIWCRPPRNGWPHSTRLPVLEASENHRVALCWQAGDASVSVPRFTAVKNGEPKVAEYSFVPF